MLCLFFTQSLEDFYYFTVVYCNISSISAHNNEWYLLMLVGSKLVTTFFFLLAFFAGSLFYLQMGQNTADRQDYCIHLH